MNELTLYKSRISLMRGIGIAQDKICSLESAIFRGEAKMEDALMIRMELNKLIDGNAAEVLEELEALESVEIN